MSLRFIYAGLGALMLTANVFAVEVPEASKHDSRLRIATYSPDQVYRINIVLGVGTRILLGQDEQIKSAAPGFGADCKDDAFDWCIVANPGTNEIYVKAKSRAKKPNNLEVTTNKRVYSFDFVLNENFDRDTDAMFRVTFKYPDEIKKVESETASQLALNEKLSARSRPRNFEYKKEVIAGSDGIDPSAAYDDGRFTYFTFAGNKQIPAAFVIESDGKETIAAHHIEGTNNDTLVVHRIAKRFVLRLENQVVGIWNESFDQVGVGAQDGVTVDGLKRVTRSQP